VESVSKFNPLIKEFDVSVFTGCYITGDINENYFLSLERSRSHHAKKTKIPSAHDVLGLFNNQNDSIIPK
jgi:amidophosphoribosyltransferase